jgi:hypothetical protein
MERYFGVKIISAEPQSFDQHAGAKNPGDLSKLAGGKDRDGYKVVYEDGYVSWSPKDVFDKAYRKLNGLTFGLAIEALKQGKRVCREGWNGKGMFLYLVKGTIVDKSFLRNEASRQPIEDSNNTETVTFLSHIDMFTAQKTVCVGWLASQTDMLSEDWIVID